MNILSTMASDCSIKIIKQEFKIGKKIDEGAFGKIYKGTSLRGNGSQYAIKMEWMRAEHPQLLSECKLYGQLHTDPMAKDQGIPGIYACGVEGEYNYMVMDLMGPSLECLLNQHSKKFGLKTVLMIVDQMISRIEYFHSRNLIHRDIKPDNFCMGMDKNKHKLYILDFGLAKQYIMKNGKHIPYRQGKSLTGTARYASINTHIGIEQSCRDDMESIGYVALYFLKGYLPWQGQKSPNKNDKYEKIKQTKIKTPTEVLCKGCPEQFRKYLQFVKKLNFDEKPKYGELRELFRNLFIKSGYVYDHEYDWCKKGESNVKRESK